MFSGAEANQCLQIYERDNRDRKKLKQAKVSGSGSEGVSNVKDEARDMFPYLAWLDPFYKPRKITSNFITVDSENEESERLMSRQIKMIHQKKRKTYLT